MSKVINSKPIFIPLMIVALLLAVVTVRARAQAPAVTVVAQLPRLSKFDALAARTGTMFKREYFPVLSARADGVQASVVRLEDLTAHEVVLSLQIDLPENHGTIIASMEEMPALKDTAAYILANVGKLDASQNPVDVEYRAISTASFGYCIHRKGSTGEELPPTAYIELPINPALPQIGGIQKLSPQLLQKMIAEAQSIMDKLAQGIKRL